MPVVVSNCSNSYSGLARPAVYWFHCWAMKLADRNRWRWLAGSRARILKLYYVQGP